ncbi:MAG TPA: phosphate ABC transporter permease PstA, partial [Gammaproteobacteria bacterium]|nr:phosphate ABC transporter permease PstA [Gammaproteobacteria bacterium]
MASTADTAAGAATEAAQPRYGVRKYSADLSAVGEPWLWGLGGALALGIILVAGFLTMIFWNGVSTFWPKPIEVVTLTDGTVVAGEPTRSGVYRVGANVREGLSPEALAMIDANDGFAHRVLYRSANFDLYGDDFRWVSDYEVAGVERPTDFFLLERQEWGPFVGRIAGLTLDGRERRLEDYGYRELRRAQAQARQRFEAIRHIEQKDIGRVNYYIERERLALRRVQLRHGEDSEQYRAQQPQTAARIAELQQEFAAHQARITEIRTRDRGDWLLLEEVGGRSKQQLLSEVVRLYPANDLSGLQKIGIYLSRWKEFLTAEPREANTEGGVLPAIFGTVAMTLIMVVIVAPFGVITALYLREYAKQGRIVSIVRVSVNNLAGVPSIVFGVFGLGFFAYTMGVSIDQLFYPERLPSPTFGTGGILWSALTLALLTVPVVIVAAEEALAAVPRSMREGSLACGASKWQTIRRVVLPRAMPGIMTGLILAMARGAGEVAPLMLVGVVKLAPMLPVDGFYPFLHLERSFMHLGFHIFDVGFQSR